MKLQLQAKDNKIITLDENITHLKSKIEKLKERSAFEK